ncbi:MAG: hypothetical protein KDE27_31390 [Planctomycetes bacterium]|nr:hypothetical protein [Planctomycetota bacterium]
MTAFDIGYRKGADLSALGLDSDYTLPTEVPDLSWLPSSGWALKGNRIPDRPVIDAQVEAAANLRTEASAADAGAGGMSVAGAVGMVIGVITQAVGAYYSVQAGKRQLRAQESALKHQARMADLNARRAEAAAAGAMRAGRAQAQTYTMQAGAAAAERAASRAASGIRASSGSAAESEAGARLVHEIDRMTIDMNATLAANEGRAMAVSLRNEGISLRANAASRAATADGLSPGLAAVSGALSGAAKLASEWTRSTERY